MMKLTATITRTARRFALLAVGASFGLAAFGAPAQALSPEGMMAKGGQLYDWYYKISEGDAPKETHASMPADSGAKGRKTWRCVTCHGYTYNGEFGMKGIMGAKGKSAADVVAILKDGTHNYTDDIFNAEEFESLGLFVSSGTADIAAATGDAAKGQGYYETICAVCHGYDGKKITDMPPLGAVVNQLPERSLHRIRFGKPAEDMPSISALPLDVAVDVWAYSKSLAQE